MSTPFVPTVEIPSSFAVKRDRGENRTTPVGNDNGDAGECQEDNQHDTCEHQPVGTERGRHDAESDSGACSP